MGSGRRVSMVLAGVLLVSALVLASCAPKVMSIATGPRAWEGGPPDGSEVPIGEVSVMCHGFAPGGVAHLELWADGAFASRAANPNPAGEYFTASLTFETTGPGRHVVHCRTYGQDGAMVQSDPVTLRVAGEEPTPTTAPPEIPTATPSSTEVPPTPTIPPPTSTPIPPTSTPIPPTVTPTTRPQPPSITYFRANGTAGSITVNAGTEVTLSWEWQRVSEGYLDPGNTPMGCPAMPCTYKVIPPANTTYTLRALGPGGQTAAQVTVVVQGDTTGPRIDRVAATPTTIYWPSTCSPSETTVSARVTDVSGVSAVKVVYRVVRGRVAGSWQNKGMTQGRTGTYSATITGSDLVRSLTAPADSKENGSLEYYLQAFDGLGNSSNSATNKVTILYCRPVVQ